MTEITISMSFSNTPSTGHGMQCHMTPGKTTALTLWTFIGKVRSLLFIFIFLFTYLFICFYFYLFLFLFCFVLFFTLQHCIGFAIHLLFNPLSRFVIAFLPRSFPPITNTKVG